MLQNTVKDSPTYYMDYSLFRSAVVVPKLRHAVIHSRVLNCCVPYPQLGPCVCDPCSYSVIRNDRLAVLLPSDARFRLACCYTGQ